MKYPGGQLNPGQLSWGLQPFFIFLSLKFLVIVIFWKACLLPFNWFHVYRNIQKQKTWFLNPYLFNKSIISFNCESLCPKIRSNFFKTIRELMRYISFKKKATYSIIRCGNQSMETRHTFFPNLSIFSSLILHPVHVSPKKLIRFWI